MSVLTQYGVSYAQAAQEDRCAPRAQVQIAAKLRRSSEAAFNVQVLDLSCAGFSCEAVTSIKPGTICWLSLPGLSGMQAEVVWNDGKRTGLRLNSPISILQFTYGDLR